MPSEFRLPALGADMDAGTVLEWHVAPGSRVKRGDVVAVVETDKGAIDVEIFEDGVVREIVVPPGEKVAVGTVLALIDAVGDAATSPSAPDSARESVGAAESASGRTAEPPSERAAATDSATASATVTAPASQGASPTGSELAPATARVRATPAARRRASELGVELETLHGTGPEDAITLCDVEAAAGGPLRVRARAAEEGAAMATAVAGTAAEFGAAAPAAPAAAVPTTPAAAALGETRGSMRAAIASAMSRSKREIPHYYLSTTADVTAATEWLAQHNAAVPVTERLLFAALLIRALALVCREVPGFSGYHRDGRYQESPAVHVGVAVALRGGGLVAPAILDTADKPLPVLMAEFRELVARARAGRLRASELAAPTIILTSLGDDPVDAVFPIIQPPQVAIVGAGAVSSRPWVVDGSVVPRQLLTLSLAADHRVTDGRLGAKFLAALTRRLCDPATL